MIEQISFEINKIRNRIKMRGNAERNRDRSKSIAVCRLIFLRRQNLTIEWWRSGGRGASSACAKLLVKYTPKTDNQPKKIHGDECQTSNILTKLEANKTNLWDSLSVCWCVLLADWLTYCCALLLLLGIASDDRGILESVRSRTKTTDREKVPAKNK